MVLPAAVLAEGLLGSHVGRDYYVRQLLDLVVVADVDESIGLGAGRLRTQAIASGAKPPPSGIDAIVAAVADAAGDDVQLVTSDPADMSALLAHADHPTRVTLLPV
jgi:predicted nucleic acid-binding protein